jgi:hypothetical protein
LWSCVKFVIFSSYMGWQVVYFCQLTNRWFDFTINDEDSSSVLSFCYSYSSFLSFLIRMQPTRLVHRCFLLLSSCLLGVFLSGLDPLQLSGDGQTILDNLELYFVIFAAQMSLQPSNELRTVLISLNPVLLVFDR